MAQKFSLYGQLSVAENLDFFASAYGLRGARKRERIAWALAQFELEPLMRLPSGQLPGGYKQRLAMATALLHAPQILFLDEPTSGADPLARREFWQRITQLAQQQVTVIVTTHFMEEAEYCDRIAILDGGRMLAEGTPASVRQQASRDAHRATMEDAFIGIVERAREHMTAGRAMTVLSPKTSSHATMSGTLAPACRAGAQGNLSAVSRSERDRDRRCHAGAADLPVRLRAVARCEKRSGRDRARGALADRDGTRRGLRAFALFRDARDDVACRARRSFCCSKKSTASFASGPILPASSTAATGKSSSSSTERTPIAPASSRVTPRAPSPNIWRAAPPKGIRRAGGASVVVQSRLWFNEANDSHYFLVPGLIVLIMTLIGAFLTTLVMAREWERGTLEALFVTPVRSGEIVLSKMIPYFALGMIGLGLCIFAAKFLFDVPFRGSVLILTGVSTLYLLVSLAIGLSISSITKSQFVASMATMVITFLPALFLSGFLFDLRSMPAAIRVISYALPARYYVNLLQTLFLAGNIWGVVLPNAAVLAVMAAVLLALARAVTTKRLV